MGNTNLKDLSVIPGEHERGTQELPSANASQYFKRWGEVDVTFFLPDLRTEELSALGSLGWEGSPRPLGRAHMTRGEGRVCYPHLGPHTGHWSSQNIVD